MRKFRKTGDCRKTHEAHEYNIQTIRFSIFSLPHGLCCSLVVLVKQGGEWLWEPS